MTFARGRHGHRVPEAVVLVLCQGAGCVCVRREEMQRVQLRLRQRGTERRPSCVTNSLVQVHTRTRMHTRIQNSANSTVAFCRQLGKHMLDSQTAGATVQQSKNSSLFNSRQLKAN